MKTFRSYELAKQFYQLVQRLKLPQHLASQIQRAAASAALNLKEGAARPTWPDRRRFYFMAFGSSKECQGVLELAGIIDPVVVDCADHLSASIYKLCHWQR